MVLSPDPVLGSLFIGNTLTSILFGVITFQTKLYFTKFPSDSRVLKVMVAFLWLAQLLEIVISSHNLYEQTNRHPESSSPILPRSSTWEKGYWYTHTIISSLIAQSFFTYRLWSLSRYRVYIGIIASLILVNFGVALSDNLNDYLGRPPEGAHYLNKVIVITTFSSVIDLAIASGVVIIMRKQRTGFVQTDRIVSWIILYGVASGVLTSLFALAILVMNLAGDGRNAVGVAMFFGGVYIASALAHLHSRAGLREELLREHRLPTGRGPRLSSIEFRVLPPNSPPGQKTTEPIPTPAPGLVPLQRPPLPTSGEAASLQVITGPAHAMSSDVASVGVETRPSASQPRLNSDDGLEASSVFCTPPDSFLIPDSAPRFLSKPASATLLRRAPPRFNPADLFTNGAVSSEMKEPPLKNTG
ncbi:hypothetical protein DL93DRAFT_2169627 [Clavulina sp. PMI_390]|nr:hypothetical protein DL93DRAFT_2169627 [Clavulina sp. PMI_390]